MRRRRETRRRTHRARGGSGGDSSARPSPRQPRGALSPDKTVTAPAIPPATPQRAVSAPEIAEAAREGIAAVRARHITLRPLPAELPVVRTPPTDDEVHLRWRPYGPVGCWRRC